MANELRGLVLTELSLVDRGANPLAHAPIFKRDNPQEENMTEEVQTEEVEVEATEAKRPAYKALYEDEQAKVAELEAKIEELEKAAVAKAAEPEEFIEVEGEQIAKSAIPAPILKALEVAAFEKRQIELEKMAKETLPHFATDVAKNLLDQITDEDLIKALQAADAAMAAMMDEIGKTDEVADFGTPKEKFDAMVKGYMAEHGTDVHKARTAVAQTETGKALQKEMLKG